MQATSNKPSATVPTSTNPLTNSKGKQPPLPKR